MGCQKKRINLLNSTKLVLGLSDIPYARNQRKWRNSAKKKLFKKLFYTRNVGYQKNELRKSYIRMNSEKVILAVSDILYGRKRQKTAKLGEKCKDDVMTPVYIASMTPLKTHDCKTYNFLNEENFGCWTSEFRLALCVLGRRPRHGTRDYSWCKEYWRSITHY